MTHILEADSIALEFGLRRILSDIHIRCSTGTITGLLGRNGQGKTCLMRIIFGDLAASSRSVRFDNRSIEYPYKQKDLIGYLTQFNFIPAFLTIDRVLRDFGLEFRAFEKEFPEFRTSYNRPVRELSGGQQRLIHLYMILRSGSRFAILDEPFTHLMPLQIEKMKEMMLEVRPHKGLLITDHLFREVMDISDHLYVLKDGKTYTATPSLLEEYGARGSYPPAP